MRRHPKIFILQSLVQSMRQGKVIHPTCLSNCQSRPKKSWMTEDEKVSWLNWLFPQLPPGEKLFVLDNHDSNINENVVKKCREANTTLFTFPPHTSHVLQPLDVGVFQPFKKYLASSILRASKMLGRRPNLEDFPSIVGVAWQKASDLFTIQNAWKRANILPDKDSIMTPETDLVPYVPVGNKVVGKRTLTKYGLEATSDAALLVVQNHFL